MIPPWLVFYQVKSPASGFDWGLGAMKWFKFGPLMICHYDWSLCDVKGNRWAVLWFRSQDALDEFYEGTCK